VKKEIPANGCGTVFKTILAAFDKYKVVGMPAAHGVRGLDNFILALIRNSASWEKVNDIEVDCGNSLFTSANRYEEWKRFRKIDI
jgi:hypothetical protein